MFRILFAALTFAVLALPASAATFQHVCTSLAACDDDVDFSFTITLDDSVVSANGSYDTTSDGGDALLGWTGSSSVGDGFVISGSLSDISGADLGLQFFFDDAGILSAIYEKGAGDQFSFQEVDVGFISYFEGSQVFSIRAECPSVFGCNEMNGTHIAANWTNAPSAIPLPAGLPLILTGLAGLAGLRMRKKRALQV